MDGERFGAGEAELLEEVDSWGGRSVGVAVEFLMGGFGGRPRAFARGRMPCGAVQVGIACRSEEISLVETQSRELIRLLHSSHSKATKSLH